MRSLPQTNPTEFIRHATSASVRSSVCDRPVAADGQVRREKKYDEEVEMSRNSVHMPGAGDGDVGRRASCATDLAPRFHPCAQLEDLTG